jgi:hypothetical protein
MGGIPFRDAVRLPPRDAIRGNHGRFYRWRML